MSGVGSSPALATCEISQVLLAGVSGGFPGLLPFRPTYRLARPYERNNLERDVKLNKNKNSDLSRVHVHNLHPGANLHPLRRVHIMANKLCSYVPRFNLKFNTRYIVLLSKSLCLNVLCDSDPL